MHSFAIYAIIVGVKEIRAMANHKATMEKKPMEHKPKPKNSVGRKSKTVETAKAEKSNDGVGRISYRGGSINE